MHPLVKTMESGSPALTNLPRGFCVLPVCACLSVWPLTLSFYVWIRGSITFIAQILHVQQAPRQWLHKFCRAGLWALMEAGHGEDDVIGLRVVTRSVSVWKHRSIAAEHINRCRNLKEKWDPQHLWYIRPYKELKNYPPSKKGGDTWLVERRNWLLMR